MKQEDINRIEDDKERERAQRAENLKVAQDLAQMSDESKEAFRNIAGFGGM